MQIYNVYQSGKRLYIDEKEIPDNKIVVNKMESEQTTLKLISDGTLPPRLYWALRNSKLSQKYFILPLINNEDLIVGTDISATPGLWDLILIGTPDDYIIEGTDIDQSKLTYISDHFGRLFVRDNFLEELDFEEQCSPTFKIFYDEILFELDKKVSDDEIPDKLSDLENDTNFISGVAFKDDGQGNVKIIGTTFSGETEEGGGGSGVNIEVDNELNETSTNPVQNKVVAKEIKTLKQKDESLDKEVIALRERNAELEETVEKLQIKTTTSPSPFHHITDSANMKVLDFGMEGKTEQDGTPTPDTPVEITNAGTLNEGTGRYEIECKVYSKNSMSTNLDDWYKRDNMNHWQCDFIVPDDVNYVTLTVKTKDSTNYPISHIAHGVKTSINAWVNTETITLPSSKFSSVYKGTTITFEELFENYEIQVEYGNVATELEPYTEQRFTLTSDRPLTKWDKLVKRDGVYGYSICSFEEIHDANNKGADVVSVQTNTKGDKYFILEDLQSKYSYPFAMNTAIPQGTSLSDCFIENNPYSKSESCMWRRTNELRIRIDDESVTDKNTLNTWIAEHPFKVVYQTQEEQAFIPLSDEEQTLLNNLETYYGATNVYNEQGCPITLTYISHPQLYVDQKLEQINNALLSLGANV